MALPSPPAPSKSGSASGPSASATTATATTARTTKEEEEVHPTANPWPGLVDLLFAYPECNLYQAQFYRLLLSLCLCDHEPSLRLVVQRSKFVARAIRVCRPGGEGGGSFGDGIDIGIGIGIGGGGGKVVSPPPRSSSSLRGAVLRCLNALRLHAQSRPPTSFLRRYLDSHDGWKEFHDTLIR